jgi:hypothetical protein
MKLFFYYPQTELDKQALIEEVTEVTRLIRDANIMSKELSLGTTFKPILRIPVSSKKQIMFWATLSAIFLFIRHMFTFF